MPERTDTFSDLSELKQNPGRVKTCSTNQMFTYALGECANSLVVNGVSGFAMLFFTKALGLNPVWAGFAIALSVAWEALLAPVIGYISDRTQGPWGPRHPYMLAGGLLMATCSYLIWYVPESFRSSQSVTLAYIVGVNLLLRSGVTLFFIPYMAFGFELCPSSNGQTRLQSFRQILNMVANFAGPALAWSIFFQNEGGASGTTVNENYRHMGAAFAICTAILVLAVVKFTFPWRDRFSSSGVRENCRFASWFRGFFAEMRAILRDPHPRRIYAFVFLMSAGMVFVSSLQIFVYDDYMRFSPHEKSLAHGSTMVGMALGAFLSVGLAKRLDKQKATVLAGIVSIAANVLLAGIFATGILPRDSAAGPLHAVALYVFVALHASYWFGNGVMLTLANAMIADVSAVQRAREGVNKGGGYSAMFSLSMRLAISLSLLVSGCCLDLIGYRVSETAALQVDFQNPVWKLGAMTFIGGAVAAAVSLPALSRVRMVSVR